MVATLRPAVPLKRAPKASPDSAAPRNPRRSRSRNSEVVVAPAAAVRTCRRRTSRTGSAWPARAVFWVSASVAGAPASIKLADLDVICVVLGCDVGELLVAEPDKVQRPVADGNDQLAATTSSSSSGGPPVTPKRRDGRSLPPL